MNNQDMNNQNMNNQNMNNQNMNNQNMNNQNMNNHNMDNSDMNSNDYKSLEFISEDVIHDKASDHTIEQVRSWKDSMCGVLSGMAMTVITLDFGGLKYLMLMIGMCLLLLGTRRLRYENRWFYGCWIITIVRTIYRIATLVINATIYQSNIYDTSWYRGILVFDVILIFLMIILLGFAFINAQRKMNLTLHIGAIIWMLLWYGAVCFLAVYNYIGIYIGILMLITYIIIIRGLFKLSNEIEEAGYVIKPSQSFVSERKMIIGIVSILVVGISCGYLFFRSYPMDWQLANLSKEKEIDAIRGHLVTLGVPEEVVNDLKEEDILDCAGALRVEKDVSKHNISNGTLNNGSQNKSKLQITGIGIKLGGEEVRWKIIHHFKWDRNPKFYGTEVIQLWPAYRYNEGWKRIDEFTGQLLYDIEEETYVAPYYTVEEELEESNHFFFGAQNSMDVFATFSFPKKGNNHRGYLSYTMQGIGDGWIIDSWLNYAHQSTWVQYPVMTAIDYRLKNNWLSTREVFALAQSSIAYYPSDSEEN